ncbi:retron Ec67 family RNA-directed DNA polymerase/endonuclease [Pseudomonas soli]|jgi:hypothetical protein|uniref:retron Ec67 family RNA-directed DNA polymerase/endonuclease n=1 Tax=Pseudomonas soli TaxID=1306993 RepID=UPI002893C92A|nr:retron Ec67 family RNA-directed DNA polymerase/endonuclease [Pseudomonas soli]MDT3712763.1 retron Ec67 family RNA-directed DNA polymerase/endonuclease [Pseudomonas soli]MDT3730100.1 retron Ec67 family RNA-directed DNA polymerase/endonuclease [Pseudomonas soli]
MSILTRLQRASSLHDLAVILNYSPSSLAYLVYKKQDKYTSFEIPKSSGGNRVIQAPCPELKKLQRKVKTLLEDCILLIDKKKPTLKSLSHGFKKEHSIASNAYPHRKKLYVFNIDIKDFFGSIHLGRIRGFLINNSDFQLNPRIATILSQIICHQDKLPQGSPTSPIASNLLGHLIDLRMVQLAKKTGCGYSRYADDLTFSTNKSEFPREIAYRLEDTHDWVPGSAILKIIHKCGFSLNHQKTRMQYSREQQTVTGIVVNQFANTPVAFRQTVRAMTHKLFTNGEYFTKEKPKHSNDSAAIPLNHKNLNPLEGMFSYIFMLNEFNRNNKLHNNKKQRYEDLPKSSLEKLHGDFLFYRYFYASYAPTIICEGKTDNIYLTCAIKSLHSQFPLLGGLDPNGKVKLKVRFFNYSKLTHRVMNLNGGTSDLANFVRGYAKQCGKYKGHPPLHPTIIFIDNDCGSQPIFNAIKEVTKEKYSTPGPNGKGRVFDSSRIIYSIAQNLFVILTPKIKGKDSMIEHFFNKKLLQTTYKGKKFEVISNAPSKHNYSKHIFAQHIVKPNQKTISFYKFSPLLKSITQVLKSYPKIQLLDKPDDLIT